MKFTTPPYHCNSKMKQLLNSNHLDTFPSRLYRNISKAIVKYVADIEDFGEVILQKRNIVVGSADIPRVLEECKDTLSLEWDCNEFYIDKEQTAGQWGCAVTYLLECLKIELFRKFPNRVFCIVISLDAEEIYGITTHCYQFHNRIFYHNTDLESYNQPVLYAVIEPPIYF